MSLLTMNQKIITSKYLILSCSPQKKKKKKKGEPRKAL